MCESVMDAKTKFAPNAIAKLAKSFSVNTAKSRTNAISTSAPTVSRMLAGIAVKWLFVKFVM